MGRTRRKKKRTQDISKNSGASQSDKVPKNFVIARGKLPILLRSLEHDIRKLMSPHTAMNLKESGKNTLKDFVHVAGPLGITHLLIMSNTQLAPYLRIARLPHGPTLTFKIHAYSLAADIAREQARPRAPASIFQNPPLVVLNGFGAAEEHLKLITIMFQNIFPVIDVNILVQRNRLPDLSALSDVSEFITKSGYGSESEIENEASKVQLPDEYGRGNHTSQQSAVKLHEVGPRMTLQLVKVEEGLCSGAIMFHEYVKKTPEEIAALKDQIEKKEALRKQRKAEQEANVQRKELLKKRRGHPKQSNEDVEQGSQEDDVDQSQIAKMDDADWYRQEVGEEPDEGFLSGALQKNVKFKRKSTGSIYGHRASFRGHLTNKGFTATKAKRFASEHNPKMSADYENKSRYTKPENDAQGRPSYAAANENKRRYTKPGNDAKGSLKRRASFKEMSKKTNKRKKTS
ncbi:hypothetical protein O6H91_19G023400 [Diphasiastrum complanatum]|uniref:Uncharacterized protein n=1 Tax=Diphasiastrum complanatum TaxID=34168 RepID=A0ACC2ATI4_DIPCM|nr:hypothetical protein O6H91_19G023400 [Diphasiastrum complanatum]